MIIVRVELWSAVTRRVTELARMRVANTGDSTRADRSDYDGCTFRGRDAKALDRLTVSRSGKVRDYPRQQQHVWNLVARMLTAMGYGGPPDTLLDGDVEASAETAVTDGGIRERCSRMLSQLQQDAILRQGSPVDDLLAFVVAEFGREVSGLPDRSLPLCLYFADETARDAFIAIVEEAVPGASWKKMP